MFVLKTYFWNLEIIDKQQFIERFDDRWRVIFNEEAISKPNHSQDEIKTVLTAILNVWD